MAELETPRAQYVQIADVIRDRIGNGDYAPGSHLPSEDLLALELGVSRVTVNRAVSLLRSAGDVTVRRGTGAVVRSLPKIRRDAKARYAARDQGTDAGEVEASEPSLRSRIEHREIGQANPPAEVAKALDLPAGAPVFVRRRVLYANDEPIQIADSYYPWSLVQDCAPLHQEDAGTGGSLTRLAEIGYPPVFFSEDVDVRPPSPEECRLLRLERNQPVFRIWRVIFTHNDRPVEVCDHIMPGHLWSLHYDWHDPISQPK